MASIQARNRKSGTYYELVEWADGNNSIYNNGNNLVNNIPSLDTTIIPYPKFKGDNVVTLKDYGK
jgi:hypothetical protein